MLDAGLDGAALFVGAGEVFNRSNEFVNPVRQVNERRHVSDLRTDMEMQSEERDSRQAVTEGDGIGKEGHRDTELILAEAGGYLIMGMGIDVGIDAQTDACGGAHRGRNLTDDLQFFHGFHIETEDTLFEGIAYLVVGLGDAGKDDLRGRKTCFDGCFDFTTADAVGTYTGSSDSAEDGFGGTCLDGIVNVDVGRLIA